MKIAVCDDDRLLTGEVDSQLQKIREKTGISFETDIFFDGETLWKAIEQNGSYDVVYLDIEMKNMDGITVARKIRERDPYAILIFISSYDSYYEQLFEVEPLRFLHKPIDPEKFDEYFRVAYTKLTSLEDRLHFEFNKRLYQIPYRDIVYMESRRRVIHLFGRNGEEYRFYKKMKDLLEEISHTGNMFIRVHNQKIILPIREYSIIFPSMLPFIFMSNTTMISSDNAPIATDNTEIRIFILRAASYPSQHTITVTVASCIRFMI